MKRASAGADEGLKPAVTQVTAGADAGILFLLADGRVLGSVLDELGRLFRVRDIDTVARLHLDSLGLGALRHVALLIRIDHAVLRGNHVPAGL